MNIVQPMKPYSFTNAFTREQAKFNKVFSSSRVRVERGIGVLKARYRLLLKRLNAEITNVSETIIACIVLHNFCILENGSYADDDGILAGLIRKVSQARNLRRQN